MASANLPKVKPVIKPLEAKLVELNKLTPNERKRVKDNRDPDARDNDIVMINPRGLSKGGSVKSSASSRADGIAQRGKTRGRNC